MHEGRLARAATVVGVAVLLVGACGGGEDGAQSQSAAGASATSRSASPGAGPATRAPASASASASPPGSPAASPSVRRPPGAPSRRTPGPSVAVSTLPPAPVGRDAPLARGVAVAITSVRDIQVAAVGPGEIAGHGISVEIRVRNTTSAGFDLGGLAVNASYGRGTPASPSSSGAVLLSGTLAAGRTATGTYVFLVPAAQSPTVRVEVSSADSPSIVVFQR